MKQNEKLTILIPDVTKHSAKMKLRKIVKQTLKNDKMFDKIKRMTKKQRYKIYKVSEQSIIKQLKKKKTN